MRNIYPLQSELRLIYYVCIPMRIENQVKMSKPDSISPINNHRNLPKPSSGDIERRTDVYGGKGVVPLERA